MFLAKPYFKNTLKSKTFDSMQECRQYLNEFAEMNLSIEDWIASGKLLEIDEYGDTFYPEQFPVIVKGQTVMRKFDFDALLS